MYANRRRTPCMEILLALGVMLAGCGKETKTQGTGAFNPIEGHHVTWDPETGLPHVDYMEEANGIPIPRVETSKNSLDLNEKIPVDVGNPAAADNPTEPVTGGRIVVRIDSEPKTMNPITESSAVQTHMGEYIHQALAKQNPETFEFEPLIAKRWATEDSVKLRPDYSGSERYVSHLGEPPETELEVTALAADLDSKEPNGLEFITYGPEKQPLGNVWVGLFPAEEIVGAPRDGHHFWSKPDGRLKVLGIKAGRYHVRTGRELIGIATESPDEAGVLTLSTESPNNPLTELLGDEKTLKLEPDDYISLHRKTVYTYFLDERAKWSDGTPYSTKDLQFAYAVINNAIVDGDSIRVYYQDVIRCDPVAPNVIQMQYRQQYFQAFEFTAGLAQYGPPWHFFAKAVKDRLQKELTLERLTPQEEEAQNKISVHGAVFGRFFNDYVPYNSKPLGTGPYVFEEWRQGERITLKRNPNYWTDKSKGHLDEITFRFISDDVTALTALKAGNIDFYFRMPAEQAYEDLEPQPDWFKDKYVKASWYIPTFSYLGWNLRRPLFQDRRVRIALGLLIDLEDFLEKKVYNEGVLVSGSAYYFGPSYNHDVAPLGYDRETALELLGDAGWVDTDGDGYLDKDGKRFEFDLLIAPGKSVTEAFASVMQENLKKSKIRMNIARLEWSSFLEKVMNKDFDVVRLGWASSPESDPYQIWHSSGAGVESRGSNHVSFDNKEADQLIEEFRTSVDQERRSQIYQAFHKLLDSEQPYTFLYTPKEFGAYHNRFRGVKWYRLRPGFDLTEWYVPKELQR